MLKHSKMQPYLHALGRLTPAIIAYTLALAALILIFFALDLVRTIVPPGVTRDPAIWGTYGEWASAILPGVAILFSLFMWHEDEKRKNAAESQRAAGAIIAKCSKTRRGHLLFLTNNHTTPVTLHDPETIIAPGTRAEIQMAAPVRLVDITVDGHTVALSVVNEQ